METEIQDIQSFKENIDAWVKQIRGEVSQFQEIPYILEENVDNTQHNYELIKEMKNEIEELKHEINALKIIQIATLKSQMKKRAITA